MNLFIFEHVKYDYIIRLAMRLLLDAFYILIQLLKLCFIEHYEDIATFVWQFIETNDNNFK